MEYKIITIGTQGCGKTSLMKRLTRDEFDENQKPTIGIDFSSRILGDVKVFVWDGNLSRYRAIEQSYYDKSHVVLVVFDLSNSVSINSLRSLISQAKKLSPGVPIILVGTKSDLPHEITEAELKSYKFPVVLVSSKTSQGFDNLIHHIKCNLK